jgi:ribulose-5-phosphate 4-epimerase/fuculose-1-phosphate aldolase
MTDSTAELRALVSTAGRILHHLGLVDYLGHSSARIPGTDTFLVKPRHSTRTRSQGSITTEDLLVVDLDGGIVAGTGEELAPGEIFIHTEIYRARPDVGAVVHTHQPMSTLMGIIEADILPLLHVPSIFLSEKIGLWPSPQLVNTAERGRELAAALGDGSFCHLQGHGIVSVAADIKTATVAAISLEQLAEATHRALQVGKTPRVIPPDELDILRVELSGVSGRWAYYDQVSAE